MDSADRMDECILGRLRSADRLRAELHALVRYGSFERGDFVPGLSDLDYFAVVETDESVVDPLEAILATCAAPLDHRGIDVAWEYRENVGDPDAGVRFKFLTVYQADFRRHHTLVYGADVVAELPSLDRRATLSARLDRLERLAADHDDPAALRMLAGETARLRALLDGAESLRKETVLSTLAANDRTEAHRIYRAYVEDAADERSAEDLATFVADQVEAMRRTVSET